MHLRMRDRNHDCPVWPIGPVRRIGPERHSVAHWGQCGILDQCGTVRHNGEAREPHSSRHPVPWNIGSVRVDTCKRRYLQTSTLVIDRHQTQGGSAANGRGLEIAT